MDQPKPVAGDSALVGELFKKMHDWARQYVDDFSIVAQNGFNFNKQIAAFHERLLLVSLGTIGLSVTALTSFIPRIPATGFPRHTFIWLIGPAWALLLISAILSVAVIGNTITANAVSLNEQRRLVETHTLREAIVPIRKLSAALTGTVNIDSQEHDASMMFSKLADQVENELLAKSGVTPDTNAKVGAFNQKWFKRMSRLALFTLYLGLILLCISAIKLFLSL